MKASGNKKLPGSVRWGTEFLGNAQVCGPMGPGVLSYHFNSKEPRQVETVQQHTCHPILQPFIKRPPLCSPSQQTTTVCPSLNLGVSPRSHILKCPHPIKPPSLVRPIPFSLEPIYFGLSPLPFNLGHGCF